MKSLQRFNWSGWIFVILLTIGWEVAVRLGPDWQYVVGPIGAAQGLHELAADGGPLGTYVSHTLYVAFIAWAIAMVVGVTIGTLLGRLRIIRTYTLSSLDFFRTVPVVALMPVMLLVLGPGTEVEVVVAAWAATWPVVVNTMGATQATNARLMDTATMFHLTRRQRFTSIILPSALPHVVVAGRLAITTSLIVCLVAEMLISPNGLGYALVRAQRGLQPEHMWGLVVLTGLIGYALNGLIIKGVNRSFPGHAPQLVG